MALLFDPERNASAFVSELDMETYFSFNGTHPRPASEEVHLRHIFRLYVCRALSKMGYKDIYVLPKAEADGKTLGADVLGMKNDRVLVAFCDKESVTPETEAKLELLRATDATILLLHSQFGEPGNVPEKFADEIAAKKLRIMAVVPPPFDDAYEYDVWIFETTFRDVFEDSLN